MHNTPGDSLLGALVERRRALHRIPEIMFDLPQTHAYLRAQMQSWNASIDITAQSGILAFFDAGQPETVAFRSDMDALTIAEESGVAFASVHPGRMHACGHDGHMAILLALGDWVNQHIQSLNRNVLLIFQPAEESGGGGRVIAESGALEARHVTRVFALHVDPMLPVGVLASRPGPFMARASEIHVVAHGVAAHAAKARDGRDALAAAARFVTRALDYEAALPGDALHMLKFGKFSAGTAVNILAARAAVGGTMRTFDDGLFNQMKAALMTIAGEAEAEYGVRFELDVADGYPALLNDAALFNEARPLLNLTTLGAPSMLAEDFSFYARRVPSLMMYLGLGTGVPLHASTFHFDEAALVPGVRAFIALAQQ